MTGSRDLAGAVDRYLLSHFRPLRDARLLVAYSGGSDSTALLHLLVSLQSRRKFQLKALWVDHGMRPEEERARERDLVETNCRAWGVELLVRSLDLETRQSQGTLGPEGMARKGRLKELTEAAYQWSASGILTAHTLDDQAETILIRLLKGNSYLGTAGIPSRRGLFYRPLLGISKSLLGAYLQAHQLKWGEDSTNSQGIYERNRFRLEVVPALDRLYPHWKESLGLWGIHRSEETGELRRSVEPWLPGTKTSGQVPQTVWEAWGQEGRLFWLGFFLQNEPGERVPRGKLVQALGILEAGGKVLGSGGRTAEITPKGTGLSFGPGITVAKSPDIGYFKAIPLDSPLLFMGRTWEIGYAVRGKPFPDPGQGEPLYLVSRSWGENWDFPQGSRGLKKLFQSWGVPEKERGSLPLLVGGHKILAVLGSVLGYEDWYRSLKEGVRPVYLHVR